MEQAFQKEFTVGWGDLDAKDHMANTSYLDAAATTRFAFFAQSGFPISRFRELHIGPIVFKDEVEYFKEMRLLESFTVNLLQDGMNNSGSVFRILNEFKNASDERVALIRSHGAWFDLVQRKVHVPPQELLAALQTLPKSETFETLPSH